MHRLEGLLDLVELDALADELLERQTPLLVQVDQNGKSRSGRQSPYHDDLRAPPREKKSTRGISSFMSGVGTPTSTTVPARSRA